MSKLEWKTLLEVYDRTEAEIIKMSLKTRGIQAELFQEGAGSLYRVNVGVLGRVEICVTPDDLPAAQAWLDGCQSNRLVSDEELGGNEEEV
jgi:hypothetical protein